MEWTAGPSESASQLWAEVYRELRQIARASMRHERPGHTLPATARVYEAYPRISQGKPVRWKNRKHSFFAMAQIMRRILVDHARECAAQKRGGERRKLSLEAAFALSNTLIAVRQRA